MTSGHGAMRGRNSGPTVLRILVGNQLRRLREHAGVTRDQAAYRIRGSEAKMSRLETGRTGFKQRDIVDLLALYEVTDEMERESVLALARQANEPGWWQPYSDSMPGWLELYVGLEQAATVIRCYESQFVPGLLQTAGYAGSVIELGVADRTDDFEQRVALRMRRQQLLIEAPAAPDFWVVLDEAVLRRTIGSAEVMREQIDHLLEVMRRPKITVQILPFERSGRVATGGPFSLLRFEEPELPDLVFVEQLTSALYLDRREDVETYLEVIDRLGATALTPNQSYDMLEKLRASL